MALRAPRVTPGLPAEEAQGLARSLQDSNDITVFVDGTVHRLPATARDAVVDMLQRLGRGEAVSVSSIEEMLTTSQAAELAGISHTYLRNMTDRGEIPVEYRGTHRRIRLGAIMAWLETQKAQKRARIRPAPQRKSLPAKHDTGPVAHDGVIRIKQQSRGTRQRAAPPAIPFNPCEISRDGISWRAWPRWPLPPPWVRSWD